MALSGRKLPRDVGFELRRGEILGIAGLVGAGRTELLRAIFGLDPVAAGGSAWPATLPRHSPAARIRAGLGFVSEDRKGEGLAQDRSIADNMTLSRLCAVQPLGLAEPATSATRPLPSGCARLADQGPVADQAVRDLSGGNQQKVALARVLHQQADMLLLDEPTRGIDVGTKAEIYRLIGELAAEGKAIMFVSSYLPELLAVCDRVGVMSRGRIARNPAGRGMDRRDRDGVCRRQPMSRMSATTLADSLAGSLATSSVMTDPANPKTAVARSHWFAQCGCSPRSVRFWRWRVVIAFFGFADWRQTARTPSCTHQNSRTIAAQTATVAVAALGMTVIIIAGGIDLSAGTALSLSATVLAFGCSRAIRPPLAVLAAIGTGCLAGMVNGVLISSLRVVPFIVTLGTMTIYLGTRQADRERDDGATRLGKRSAVARIARGYAGPSTAWLLGRVAAQPGQRRVAGPALAVLLALVLRYTVFGRYVFALGSNESTARLCGINVPLVKIAVYTLGGSVRGHRRRVSVRPLVDRQSHVGRRPGTEGHCRGSHRRRQPDGRPRVDPRHAGRRGADGSDRQRLYAIGLEQSRAGHRSSAASSWPR